MRCPECNAEIPKEQINVQTDIAQCTSCNNIFKISENITVRDDGFDIKKPPQGAWIRNEWNSLVIGATTRSWVALFIVPFMVVWSGFSLGGIYGSQLLKGHFDPVMSLFGIPFILGSVIFWTFALMTIFGKVELTLDKQGGKTFTGIGNVGLTRRFTWDEISSISERPSYVHYPGSQGGALQLEGKKRISFGLGVKEERRYYLFKAMRQVISKAKANKNFTQLA